jgi:hypothetical protein
MRDILDSWKAFEAEVRVDEAMAGLNSKERDRKKRDKKSSERIRRTFGDDESVFPGKDELDKLSKGMTEANPAHDKKTGRFPKGGAKRGDVYSISKAGARRSGVDQRFAKKGIYSGGKKKDGTPKTHAKYGMPDQCGRVNFAGEDIEPEFRCRDFKERYNEHDEPGLTASGEDRVSREYVAGTIRREIEKAIKAIRAEVSKGRGGCSLEQVIRIVDKFENATKGKAFVSDKKSKK